MFEPERALLSFARRRVRLALGVGEERRAPRCLCAAPRPGSPFLWVLSFGEAKESTPTAIREPQLNLLTSTESRRTARLHVVIKIALRPYTPAQPKYVRRHDV